MRTIVEMTCQAIKFHYSCRYLILCSLFGGFISVILLYNELSKFPFVSRLLEVGSPMFFKKVNCSGIIKEDVPVWSSDEVRQNVKTGKMQFLTNYKNPCWYEWVSEEPRTSQNVESQGNSECPIRLRCLPYFMIIGQPKCATTDLYFRLSLHPQIESSAVKGPHWWTRKRYYGVPFATYVSLFDEAAEIIRKTAIRPNRDFQYNVVTGEASPSTLWDAFGIAAPSFDAKKNLFKQEIAAEIKSLIPGIKLIVILRNPIERLYSDYLYFKNDTKSPDKFHRLANNSVIAFNNCTRFFSDSYCLHNYYVKQQLQVRLNLGVYAVYLEEWYQVFPKEQIFIINFDDYVLNMKEHLMKMFHFLQLRDLNYEEASEILMQPPHNANPNIRKYGKMLPQTKNLLENFYARFNERLALLLQNNNFLWKKPKKLKFLSAT